MNRVPLPVCSLPLLVETLMPLRLRRRGVTAIRLYHDATPTGQPGHVIVLTASPTLWWDIASTEDHAYSYRHLLLYAELIQALEQQGYTAMPFQNEAIALALELLKMVEESRPPLSLASMADMLDHQEASIRRVPALPLFTGQPGEFPAEAIVTRYREARGETDHQHHLPPATADAVQYANVIHGTPAGDWFYYLLTQFPWAVESDAWYSLVVVPGGERPTVDQLRTAVVRTQFGWAMACDQALAELQVADLDSLLQRQPDQAWSGLRSA